MDSPWAPLVLCCSFALFQLSFEQSLQRPRQVTLDADGTESIADLHLMQREVDLDDLFDPKGSLLLQREVTSGPLSPDLLKAFNEQGWPVAGPRSFGGPPVLDYPVEFPPGRPTPANLRAICLHGDRRPRYPRDYFPASGFGQQKRRAEAVNHAEALFGVCCRESQSWEQEERLCCVRKAWRQAVESFCEEDTSVKDRIYRCCFQTGPARLSCFQSDAPNPTYQPTMEIPVMEDAPLSFAAQIPFDPNTCRRSAPTRRSITAEAERASLLSAPQNTSITFPPGRPSADDIDSVCRHRKLRPHYDLKCLPAKGYGWLARQAKALNRLEKGFKQCCKGKQEVLPCADGKWREAMDRYCREEKEGRMNFPCCEREEGEERYACFHARAPHRGYDADPPAAPVPPSRDSSLGEICETHKIVKKKALVGFPLQNIVNQCCPLPSTRRSSCVQEKLTRMSKNLCSARKPSSPLVVRCCRPSSNDASLCLADILRHVIIRATSKTRLRKRMCPLS